MREYCQSCSQPTEYVGARPKFCSSCGSPMGSVAVEAVATAKADNVARAIREVGIKAHSAEESMEQLAACVAKLRVPAVEITPFKRTAVSFKDVLTSGLEGPRELNRPNEGSPDELREQWKREASATRNQSSQEDFEIEEDQED